MNKQYIDRLNAFLETYAIRMDLLGNHKKAARVRSMSIPLIIGGFVRPYNPRGVI